LCQPQVKLDHHLVCYELVRPTISVLLLFPTVQQAISNAPRRNSGALRSIRGTLI